MDPEFTSHLLLCSLEDNLFPEKIQEGIRNLGTLQYLFTEQENEGLLKQQTLTEDGARKWRLTQRIPRKSVEFSKEVQSESPGAITR